MQIRSAHLYTTHEASNDRGTKATLRNAAAGRASAWKALLLGLAFVPATYAAQLTVSWDVNSTGQLGFNVERSQDGAAFTQIATVAPTVNTYTDSNVGTGSYSYRVRAFNATAFSAYSNVATSQIAAAAPSFTTQPVSQSAAAGADVSFSASASGQPSYQWKKNGVAISGATNSTLIISGISSASAGSYTVTATNSGGSVESIAAVLNVTTVIVVPPPVVVPPASRLANVSARAVPGKGGSTLNMSFKVGGQDAPVLVRAVGPGLAAFTTTSTYLDPKVTLSSAGTAIATNDNWGGSAALATSFSQMGAFPLAATSKDAALFRKLAPSTYTADLSGRSGGLAMLEVYAAEANGGTLSQVDATSPVGVGEERLIVGFTVSGTYSLRVLIRAVGPSLGGKASLKDPQLELHRGVTLVQRNDNWGGTAALKATFTAVGASALPVDSKDAAMDVTLEPGTYTATIAGTNGTVGLGRLEIYEVR